jgi:hypothetical protein
VKKIGTVVSAEDKIATCAIGAICPVGKRSAEESGVKVCKIGEIVSGDRCDEMCAEDGVKWSVGEVGRWHREQHEKENETLIRLCETYETYKEPSAQ